MDYGKAFREIRAEKKTSRAIVARGLGCTQSALSKIENGKVTPKQATIEKLCQLYGIPLARFYCIAFEPADFEPTKTIDELKAEARQKMYNYARSLAGDTA